MRKIIGYKVVTCEPHVADPLPTKVMEEVAKDPRWELAGGLVYCPPPMQRGVFMQALVMYEEVKEPREAAGWTEADLFAAGMCTRGPGHTGSCNGFWHEQCGQFKALP